MAVVGCNIGVPPFSNLKPVTMKQYKLVIKENFSENISGLLNTEAKSGWKLNSYESSKPVQVPGNSESNRQRVVLVFEK